MISKTRKSIKPTRKVFHVSGTAIRAMSCPATSSMTTNCGSFVARSSRHQSCRWYADQGDKNGQPHKNKDAPGADLPFIRQPGP